MFTIDSLLSLKVLKTTAPKKGSKRSFATLKGVSNPPLKAISTCFWMAIDAEHLGDVWSPDNEYFGMKFLRDKRKYIYIGHMSSLFYFPKHYNVFFIPLGVRAKPYG